MLFCERLRLDLCFTRGNLQGWIPQLQRGASCSYLINNSTEKQTGIDFKGYTFIEKRQENTGCRNARMSFWFTSTWYQAQTFLRYFLDAFQSILNRWACLHATFVIWFLESPKNSSDHKKVTQQLYQMRHLSYEELDHCNWISAHFSNVFLQSSDLCCSFAY